MNSFFAPLWHRRHLLLMVLATLGMAALATVALLSRMEVAAILYKAF